MIDHKELIERLRDYGQPLGRRTIEEAADAIEALQADVDVMHLTNVDHVVTRSRYVNQIEALQTELRNANLRIKNLEEEETQSQRYFDQAIRTNEFLSAERDTLQHELLKVKLDRPEAPATKPEMVWECNECGSQEYSGAICSHDVHELGCGNCGSSEWHLAPKSV